MQYKRTGTVLEQFVCFATKILPQIRVNKKLAMNFI